MFLHNTVSPVWAESAGKLNLGREIFTATASLLRLEFQYRTVCSRQTAQPLPSITIKPHIESYCNGKMRVCLRRPEICLASPKLEDLKKKQRQDRVICQALRYILNCCSYWLLFWLEGTAEKRVKAPDKSQNCSLVHSVWKEFDALSQGFETNMLMLQQGFCCL